MARVEECSTRIDMRVERTPRLTNRPSVTRCSHMIIRQVGDIPSHGIDFFLSVENILKGIPAVRPSVVLNVSNLAGEAGQIRALLVRRRAHAVQVSITLP